MGYFIDELAAPGASRQSALRDARGCPVGTASREAVDHVETALDRMLSYFGDPLQALADAAQADPGWAYPQVLQAALLLTTSEHGPSQQAGDLLAGAAALSCNAREAAHLRAARAAFEGDWDAACDAWDRILVDHPRDVAALLFAHLFDFYRGDSLNLRRRPQRVLPAWSPELPLYGYVLGLHAFGLEECNQYAEAEDAGRAALEVNRRDPWAVHAVTHVFEMQGRHEAGSRWLESRLPDWSVANGFAFHNWFHAALFHLERMDTAGALAVYDSYLAPVGEMALQKIDRTAILWRLMLLGVDVRERFADLAGQWPQSGPEAGFYAFNDVHALLAQIGTGDVPAAREAGRSLLGCMAMPDACGPANRRMAAEVGLPLARALAAYGEGNYAAAAEGLWEVRDRAQGFGGSHAQRDLITLTLMDAALRSGRHALARHVLNERRPAKSATPLTQWWQQRADPA